MNKQTTECYTMILRDGQRIPITIDRLRTTLLDHHGPVTSCVSCMEEIRQVALAEYGSEIKHLEPDCGRGQREN